MLLMMPHGYDQVQPDALPPVEAVKVMMAYNAELQKAGVLLDLNGLTPPSAGTRVTAVGGKVTVTDGPFAEAKEALGGYWIIQVKSKEEAVEWATRCPGVYGGVIELRRIQDLDEFPPEIQSAMRQTSLAG